MSKMRRRIPRGNPNLCKQNSIVATLFRYKIICTVRMRIGSFVMSHNHCINQSRTQSNACARARMALALGKLNFSCAVIGLMCMPTKPEPLNLGVPVVNFPRANAILARAQALLWVRDCASIVYDVHRYKPLALLMILIGLLAQ